jgi:mRNA interferase MazF
MDSRHLIKRYDIYLANLDPTVGSELSKTRPCVVVSDNFRNKHLETIVVCPLTTVLHPTWRSRFQVVCAGKKAEIAVDQIRSISKKRLVKKVDSLSVDEAKQLRMLIAEMYGESKR